MNAVPAPLLEQVKLPENDAPAASSIMSPSAHPSSAAVKSLAVLHTHTDPCGVDAGEGGLYVVVNSVGSVGSVAPNHDVVPLLAKVVAVNVSAIPLGDATTE